MMHRGPSIRGWVVMAAADMQEQVRAWYAAAATAVSLTGREALAVVDADQCCPPTTAEANASCCGGGGEVDAAFGSALYSAGEQGELPAEAVAASLGCGNPLAVAECALGNGSWTWARVGASTCCSRRAGSGTPGSPTAST